MNYTYICLKVSSPPTLAGASDMLCFSISCDDATQGSIIHMLPLTDRPL